MISREGLWRRVAGAGAWPAAWGLALAAGLPWLLPETWNGGLSLRIRLLGWLGLMLLLPLLRWRRTWPLPFAALLGWLTLLGLGRAARLERALPTGLVRLEGTIDAPWQTRPQSRVSALKVSAPATLAGLDLPVSLPVDGLPPPAPGTPIAVQGELQPVESGPAFLGERPLWRARALGQTRRLRLHSAAQFEAMGPAHPNLLLRLRTFLHHRVAELQLTPLARDLWGALTLGISPAQPESYSAFTESGTIHVLVVSGLQITLMIAVAEALARRLMRRGAGLVSVGLGLLYACVVGFSAPVWRGLFMGAAWAFSRSRGWALPPVLTLHLALLLWLLVYPAAGADPGFLLAWSALLGVIWVAEPLAGLAAPLLGRWALPAARLLAPWLTTLPLLALFHGGVPLWGVVANVLVLPLVAVLTPICLGLTVLPLPGLVGATGALLAWTGGSLLPWFARIQPIATAWTAPFVTLALGWMALAHAHGRQYRTRALAVALVTTSALLLAFRGLGRPVDTLTLEAIDIGQGDALLLRAPGSDALLVDTGGTPWAARRIARVLSRRGVREPVHLLLTHPHGDHVGGWATLARLWPLATQRRTSVTRETDLWGPFAPEPLRAEAWTVLRGDHWNLGGIACDVRWPPKPFDLGDPNGTSAVTRVRWRNRELWLMGDALALQEQDLLDLGDPGGGNPLRLLKPGHHGAAGASSEAWIQALRPGFALVTAGRDNAFGFPHEAVRQRLKAVGCTIAVSGATSGARVMAVPEGWKVLGNAP